jgi:hypothetical protein
MTRGWSLKVRALLEVAASVAGAWTTAAAGSEGADIVGKGRMRCDLASAGSDCDGDGAEAFGLGLRGFAL